MTKSFTKKLINVQLQKIKEQKEKKKKSFNVKITKVLKNKTKKQQWLQMKSTLKTELYSKLLKKHVDIYTSTEIGMSNTSTSAFLYKDKYKLSKVNNLTRTYGQGNMQHIEGFVKITEIETSKCNKNIQNSPNLKEIKLFNTTNKLIDLGILNSFVYSFNKLLLNKCYAKFEGKQYSVLITEDISKDYKELTTYLLGHKNLPECVLFELVYTLHTLSMIKMKHMDLHGANIFIKTLPKSEHKMIKYKAVVNNKMHSFYVPTTHVIKIIDLDSGHKTANVSKEIKTVFKETINNPYKFTGKVKTNNKSNILKLVHTLIRSNPTQKIANQLFYMGIKSSSRAQSVPFYPNSNSIQLNKTNYNSSYLKNYGILIKKKNRQMSFLNISDNVIWTPDRMLFEMIQLCKFQQPSEKHHIIYSQEHLYK